MCLGCISFVVVCVVCVLCVCCVLCFFQAEDGIRDLVRSRGLGDVYKRQVQHQQPVAQAAHRQQIVADEQHRHALGLQFQQQFQHCLLYTSDAADERSSVDLGGRRIIKKKIQKKKNRKKNIDVRERSMQET